MGPDVRLGAKDMQAFANTIHELVTNAAKYGAIAAAQGRIEIKWRLEDWDGRNHLLFHWREHGVRIARRPERRGFGTEVIESHLPYRYGGSSTLAFHPDGVECIMDVPLPQN